jgi:hypothetical protein
MCSHPQTFYAAGCLERRQSISAAFSTDFLTFGTDFLLLFMRCVTTLWKSLHETFSSFRLRARQSSKHTGGESRGCRPNKTKKMLLMLALLPPLIKKNSLFTRSFIIIVTRNDNCRDRPFLQFRLGLQMQRGLPRQFVRNFWKSPVRKLFKASFNGVPGHYAKLQEA